MESSNFLNVKTHVSELRNADKDSVSEASESGTSNSVTSAEDLQNVALILGLANAEDVHQERFRVDRRRLEGMLADNLDVSQTAQAFFQKVMDETRTVINWPARLKIGARSKKDPHVRISGLSEDVKLAREKIMQLLDTRSNRVTMKIDVSYTDHSHIIGKGGLTIKRVMEETGCHIHFPDSNRTSAVEKSNQVSIAGDMERVERARARVRALTPLIFTFELPVVAASNPLPEITSPYVQQIQDKFNVQVMIRNRPKLHANLVVVKGVQWEVQATMEATTLLLNYMCGQHAKQTHVQMTLEISPMHHPVVVGRSSEQLKVIMRTTGAQIMFPDAEDPNIPALRKSCVTITGAIQNVYAARQQLVGSLPLVVIFDVPDDMSQRFENDNVTDLMNKFNVYISVRRKLKQGIASIVIKGIERCAADIYEARRELLGKREASLNAEIPESYNIPSLTNVMPNFPPFNPFSPSHSSVATNSPCSQFMRLRNGDTIVLRALIDPCSQSNFVTEAAAQLLNLERTSISGKITGISSIPLTTKSQVTLNFHAIRNPSHMITSKAYVLRRINSRLPSQELPSDTWPSSEISDLADPHSHKPGSIDVLLGAVVYAHIILDGIIKRNESLVALNSRLGWLVSGEVTQSGHQSHNVVVMHTQFEVDQLLRQFWEINEYSPNVKPLSKPEMQCEEHFKKTHTRNTDGRYEDLSSYGSPMYGQHPPTPGGFPAPMSPAIQVYGNWLIPSPQPSTSQFHYPMPSPSAPYPGPWNSISGNGESNVSSTSMMQQYPGSSHPPNCESRPISLTQLLNSSSACSSGYQSNFTGSSVSIDAQNISAGAENSVVSPSVSPISKSAVSPAQSSENDRSQQQELANLILELKNSDRRAPGCEKKTLETIKQLSPLSEYRQLQQEANKAMRENVGSGYRVPTTRWSGHYFSNTMPASNGAEPESSHSTPDKQRNILDLSRLKIADNCATPPKTKPCRYQQLYDMLQDIGLQKYIDLFKTHELDMSTFASLNDADLIEIGVTAFGARRKMLLTIAKLQKQASSSGSVTPNRNLINSPPQYNTNAISKDNW
ncbi:unnamed protein product [Pieris macdunnoughi]|uniref:SAM domain-containing protein n=1 Tax=Pieris macdunnoughi TaxID=345717 RepID=A0A821WM14_9NEOP|nr:unnamed protein product [Pieris macdunnoughi]